MLKIERVGNSVAATIVVPNPTVVTWKDYGTSGSIPVRLYRSYGSIILCTVDSGAR
jgi:hypothetical protein